MAQDNSTALSRLLHAFEKDGFEARSIITKFNGLGIMAEHKTAKSYDTGNKKRLYYLKGTPYEMGYLMGLLAEPEIARMTEEFTEKVVFSFIGSKVLAKVNLLRDAFTHVIGQLAGAEFPGMPQEIRDEIQGIYDGCRERNPMTRVAIERLMTLNLGIDVILSMVYSGNFLLLSFTDIKPVDINLPLMCNAFSVFGKAAGGGHFFGRDFMFPTADVFQETAAMILYDPVSINGQKTLPFVSVAAPGMIGSISAMNIRGMGMGVDMSPAALCDPTQIGINSLLLVRKCIQYGTDARHIIDIMRATKRGVSWNYIVSDGINDRACVVEAGKSGIQPDPLLFPMQFYLPVLPDYIFMSRHESATYDSGLMVRWNDYHYPKAYLDYNKGLWKRYNNISGAKCAIAPDAFDTMGFINSTWKDGNCPSAYYFAPQREDRDDVVLTTNHYIIPEMRYYAMYPWTTLLVSEKINDIQWRYDALNYLILKEINEKGHIDYQAAKRLIDYLSPYGPYPSYYAHKPKSRDKKEIRIDGCTSIFDLKKKTVESHYGYYCDEWVKVTLPNYFDPAK
jgi:hypothetical protein